MPYEYHNYEDEHFKIIFHLDYMEDSFNDFGTHWHKNPELLYFVSGSAQVRSDALDINANSGDIIAINSNRLHSVKSISGSCEYYCLIPDYSFMNNIDFLPSKCRDEVAVGIFKSIISEFEQKEKYYKLAISGYVSALLAQLARNSTNSESANGLSSQKLSAVKLAIQYIYEHFNEDISVEQICREVGLSQYYLCHIFKEATGQTILRHLNYIRCNNAKYLLKSGKQNVAGSAYESGFSNLSYFSKTYKAIIGNLPSADVQK